MEFKNLLHVTTWCTEKDSGMQKKKKRNKKLY